MLAEPVAALAAAAGYPILAEPTSQLRRGPARPLAARLGLRPIARERPQQLEPELILRVGDLPTSKPLRQWLAGDRGARARSSSTRSATGRSRPGGPDTIVRADPIATARSLTERLARLRPGASAVAGSPFAAAWLEAERGRPRGASTRGSRSSTSSASPASGGARRRPSATATPFSPPRACRCATSRRSCRPGPERVRFLANRGANGIDGLVSTAAGLAAASGARTWAVLGDLALFHDLGGLAAAARPPDLRLLVIDNARRRHLPLPPAGRGPGGGRVRGAARHARPAWTPLGPRSSSGSASTFRRHPGELDEALAGDARMIVVRTDREPANLASSPPRQRSAQPASSGSSASSLSSVSCKLGGGVGVRDDPAARVEMGVRSRSSAERSATQNSPSSAASIQPTGPAYQPRSIPSSSSISAQRRLARLAADRRRRVQQARQLDRASAIGELGADRRRQVLDVARPWRRRARPRPGPRPSAGAARARSAGRRCRARRGPWGCAASPRRGGRRRRGRRCAGSSPASATVAATAPERRISSSGLAPMKAASGVPTQKQKQDGKSSRRAPSIGAGSWAAGASTVTSRASTTLSTLAGRIGSTAAATICS